MLKKLIILLVVSIQIFLTASCGSVSSDGATSLFQTASVSFTATTVDNVSSTVTAKPNTDDSATKATLTIIVTPYPGFIVSPFTVRDLQYTYTQTSGGVAGFTVNGANFSTNMVFTPVLASGDVKDRLVDLGFASGTPWIFNVQATYTVVEDNSGKTRNYSVPLGSVRFI